MRVIGCLGHAKQKIALLVTHEDEDFLRRFEKCKLPEHQWTHMAHLRVAWICLRKFPANLALQRIRNGILRYNTEVLNRRHKYHETVTVAFTRVVADRIQELDTWTTFADHNQDLLSTDNPILLRYYSETSLFSVVARSRFVAPDLLDLSPLNNNDKGAQGG